MKAGRSGPPRRAARGGLFWQLLAAYFFITLAVLLAVGAGTSALFGRYIEDSRAVELAAVGREIGGLVQEEGRSDTIGVTRMLETAEGLLQARVWIVDAQGRVIGASSDYARWHNLRVPAEDLRRLQRGEVVRGRWSRYFGVPTFSIAVPEFYRDRFLGAVYLHSPLGPVEALGHNLRLFFVYSSLAAALLSALLSYVLSRRVAEPMRRMSLAAQELARGRYQQSFPVHSPGEIGELAASLAFLAGELGRLERVRRELVANVSHELRGPLARVQGYIAAIEDGVGGPEERGRHWEIIKEETQRLSLLVSSLLDFSQLETGRLRLNLEPAQLRHVLERVGDKFASQAQRQEIHLVLQLPDFLPLVLADLERIEQVLHNLCENALRFTPPGGTVRISAEARPGQVRVEVRDSGPGIPPEDLPGIWERFYKADKARTPAEGPGRSGTGLGLAIVRQLVELHGGQVGVESRPEEGAAFWFTIPTAKLLDSEGEFRIS